MPDRLVRLLFIVVLVLSQFSLLLHQADIEHHAGGKICAICLASPGLDHALTGSFLPPAVEAAVECPLVLPACITASRSPARLVARSPPVSALHA